MVTIDLVINYDRGKAGVQIRLDFGISFTIGVPENAEQRSTINERKRTNKTHRFKYSLLRLLN